MRRKLAGAVCIMAAVLLCAFPASAKNFVTSDGVLSIDMPDDTWSQVEDPNTWLSFSDGNDEITIQHLANGEKLPDIMIADSRYIDVYQVYFSTQNEVFVITGMIADAPNIDPVRGAISSAKVLKYDTKKAIPAETVNSTSFAIDPIGKAYVVNADSLNVWSTCSTDSQVIGTLRNGNGIYVIGNVTYDGEDYGWYQVDYLGTSVGYVMKPFLSEPVQNTPIPTPEPDPIRRTGKVNGLYYKNTPVSIYEYTDGTWRDDDDDYYTFRGNDLWTDQNGQVFYSYYSAVPFRIDGSHAEPAGNELQLTNWGLVFTISQYDNGSWYDDSYIEYVQIDDDTWMCTANQTTYKVYEEEPVFKDDDDTPRVYNNNNDDDDDE